jgi:hypothetical protein
LLFGKRIVVVLPAYSAELTLRQTSAEIPRADIDDAALLQGSDDFVFDNRMSAQIAFFGSRSGASSDLACSPPTARVCSRRPRRSPIDAHVRR